MMLHPWYVLPENLAAMARFWAFGDDLQAVIPPERIYSSQEVEDGRDWLQWILGNKVHAPKWRT